MNNTISPTVICLFGPTATGKTDLAIELVKRFPCSIVSVDSAMIYRGMDIGTAKPSLTQLKIAPHRLLNIREPNEIYSAGDFVNDAKTAIDEILAKQQVPLLVGGTMMYFQRLQSGIADLPKRDDKIRKRIEEEAEQLGWQALHERLALLDPEAALRIHPHDPQRIERALEVYEQTGQTITALQQRSRREALPYRWVNIGLQPEDRALLHQRIEERFTKMLADGLIAEVEGLVERYHLEEGMPALRLVGYRQVFNRLRGIYDQEEMRQRAVAATRQLARRQLTWLRSWPEKKLLFSEDKYLLDQLIQYCRGLLDSRAADNQSR